MNRTAYVFILPLLLTSSLGCSKPDVKDSVAVTDADGDGFDMRQDCTDEDAFVNPDATEVCDGIDNDCDGIVDNDDAVNAKMWYVDADNDGYGELSLHMTSCEQLDGFVGNSDDCDDREPLAWTDATEVCDEVDNDCDGIVDNDDAINTRTWFADADLDGYGNPTSSVRACDQPWGFVADDTDCMDNRATTYPGAEEYCNGEDDDCDGIVDEYESIDAVVWCEDSDGDAYSSGNCVTQCSSPGTFWSATNPTTDCDDSHATSHPDAIEYCNAKDDDCDGAIDEDDAFDAAVWCEDSDGDGYSSTRCVAKCISPGASWSATNPTTDCDDSHAASYPGAVEYCNAKDDDCDGTTDEDDSIDAVVWCEDSDGDGYSSTHCVTQCTSPGASWSATKHTTDCDDAAADVNPGAIEICDGKDNDCTSVNDDVDATASSCSASSADLVQCCIDSLGSSGGTVYLDWSGTSLFYETIDLRSDLTLQGTGASATVLQFAGSSADDLIAGDGASDVVLSDFTLYGTRTTSDYECWGSSCDGATQACLLLVGSSSAPISDITILDVVAKYCEQYGLHIKYADRVYLEAVTTSYNGTWSAEDHNLYIFRSTDILILDSESRYSAGHGINLRGCQNVVVKDTVTNYNHHNGLRVSGESSSGVDAKDILLDNTDSIGNDQNGVEFMSESGYNVVRGCLKDSHIASNAGYGAYFYYATNYQRSNNTYSSNGTKECVSSADGCYSTQSSSTCASVPTSSFPFSY